MSSSSIRPTKKQRELLVFIEQFIGEHGYSPSYREIMNGLDYTSVATVSLHISSLIRRGHLRKRDRSARSLEVVHASATAGKQAGPAGPDWLIGQIERRLEKLEAADFSDEQSEQAVAETDLLIRALSIIGRTAAADELSGRLQRFSDSGRTRAGKQVG